MSRPHCSGRSGSFDAAEALAGSATQRSRATRNARDVRTGSISPARACSTPLSGADSVVSHELEDVSGAAAKRRRGLGRLVRADEVERLLRRLDERDEALEAAETPRLVAQNLEERGLAAVGLAPEQHHRAAAADAVGV